MIPDAELIIGEGIESTLSARSQIFDLAWLVGGFRRRPQDASELPPSRAPDHPSPSDNDVSSAAGQHSRALAAYDRWIAEGRSVRIKCPPTPGDDFNNVLVKRRADARH